MRLETTLICTLPHHHPPHFFKDNAIYFITGRTINKIPYFNTNKKMGIFCLCLKAGLQKFNFKLFAWVSLPNHYHLLIKVARSENLSKFINFINGKSSFQLNNLENKRGRKIWYQYFDRCIRSEKDFYTRLNYIHHNPVKHGYAKQMGDYNFSSYQYYLKKYGQPWLNDCFAKFPIIDFTCQADPD